MGPDENRRLNRRRLRDIGQLPDLYRREETDGQGGPRSDYGSREDLKT